jgi:hypothetical protein
MALKKTFLIVAFGMVTIIALLYGISPQWFGRTFLGIEQLDRNIAHILRAVMGLYIALGLFWLYSAFHAPFRNVAILTSALFAGGLVAGRIISLAIEGTPAPLLIFYVIAELTLAPLAWWIYTREE